MKKTGFAIALAFAAALTHASGWETADAPRLYGATFTDYTDGEALSDKGATGGTWRVLGDNATAASSVDGRKCMTCELVNLLFDAESVGWDGPKVSKASVYITGVRELPALGADDKAAFAIRTQSEDHPDGPVFAGWTSGGWQVLYADSVSPVANKWYDLSVWFVQNLEKKIQVQYRLKVGDAYEPLHAKDGTVWFDSVVQTDASVREIEIRGTGAFAQVSGRELPSPGLSVHMQ